MIKKSVIILLGLIICISFTVSAKKRKDLQMGGRIGYTIPNNWGKATTIGFKDVSAKGAQFALFGRWFYAKRLTLGWDFAYQIQNGNKAFWDVDNYGEVTASYQTIQLLAEGNYFFSHDEFRPYIGVAFGAFWLRNNLDFSSYNINNNSVMYTADNVMPGVAPQLGIAFELSEKTMLDIHARLILIPNLEEEYVQDEEIGLITLNPHGAQNHLSLSIGLLFNL